MKHFIIAFLLIFLYTNIVLAQDETEEKLSKQEKKELKRQKRIEAKDEILEWVKKGAFVIETHTLYDKQHNVYNISPHTNFVMVDGEELTIQLVFPSTPDWNGVGGITMEGRITKYDITEGKENKPVEIKMYASGTTMGAVTLFFSIDFGKFAKVRYSDIQGLKLTFSGAFVALEESGVFKSLNTN